MKLRQRLKITGSAVALSGLLFMGGCAKTMTDNATLALTAGDYENAANYAVSALRDDPSDPYAMMVAGLAFEGLGFPNKSRRYYEDILEMNGGEISMFGAFKPVPPEEMTKTAARRLTFMEHKKRPFAAVNPETGTADFTDVAFNEGKEIAVTGQISPQGMQIAETVAPIKGGLDMLSEGERNIVQRFLTFLRLTDEQLATRQEFEERRAANLGGLLPYTLAPAGLGMDLPVPSAETIIDRLNALKTALELRSITPREHAVEREMILEALLPSNPQRRMTPVPPPVNMLEGATALRRIEMLKNLGLITPAEAEQEQEAIEKLVYLKLGMTDANKGINAKAASACITKCLNTPSVVCPQTTTASKKKTTTKRKTTAKKTSSTAKKKTTQSLCPCP